LATSECDIGLEEKEYLKKNCLSATVLCTIIMVYKGTSSSYRSVDCIGFDLAWFSYLFSSTSVSLWCYLSNIL